MAVNMQVPAEREVANGHATSNGHAITNGKKEYNASKPQGETGEFSGNIKVSQKAPTASELNKVADFKVLDKDGNPHPFRSLYSSKGENQRVLIIFIRHFFCGNCQEYLRTLSASISLDDLSTLSPPTQIVVIGCGQPDLIDFYSQTTNCPYPLYADPTKKLYALLGMTRTLNLGPSKPSYMKRGLLANSVASIVQSFANGRKALHGGDYWQVGGEFMFEVDGSVSWCHRMENTRDHAEVPEIRKRLGFDQPAVEESRPARTKRWSMVEGLGMGRRLSVRKEWSRSRSRKRLDSGVEANGGLDQVDERVGDEPLVGEGKERAGSA